MHYKMNDLTIILTCTMREIARLETGHQIWATPTPAGEAAEIYLSSQPHFRDDFVLATAEDFLEAEGWTATGWDEMDDDAQEATGNDETTITMQRAYAEVPLGPRAIGM